VSDAIITVQHLSHIYAAKDDNPLRKMALDDVSLEIEQGSCVAVIGVTGSGKSTLVQHFNGLLRPTGGKVIVHGIDTSDKSQDITKMPRHG